MLNESIINKLESIQNRITILTYIANTVAPTLVQEATVTLLEDLGEDAQDILDYCVDGDVTEDT